MKWISAPKAAPKAILGSLSAALIFVSVPAAAQDARLDRIERQLNALQRAVFPGGDGRFFEPEITPETAANPQVNTPQVTTTALTDVLARLDAIEQQLARLTAATEVNENALTSLEERVAAMETGGSPPAVATNSPTGVIPVPEETAEVDLPEPPPQPEQNAPSPERLAAVQAIAKPATGDQGDDEYVYGFRLWDAGFYPEAQQQLAMFVEQYPNHWRTTYGRNLLGRAFLDAGEPRAAATHFFENYQNDNSAARAPDSLLYLAESMIALGDTRRACIALAEFGDGYPALAVGRLSGMYEGLSGRVDCN
ncbi:tetratricopeptide repeat protein [Aurantiacibacter sp. D1-12]|uniref:tetratricopeptide repeat protein n=1 Tax=Aurantiacibacter sp. D1-12 TaxID=2993658 RepID=UPI00237CF51E|nr:tetratricopeptide repeat protein [Aurantiacibacter sp. D1-12]MDE1467125.1 tetratricopeptide repeat protein [Aurantiacibacter sp. D1-12]